MTSSSSRFLVTILLSMTTLRGDAKQFELPPLPYGYDALEPMISANTLTYHHDKHHAKYVNTMNSMIKGQSELESMETIEEILVHAHEQGNTGLFNNAAQSWNHEFYWNCMTPPSKSSSISEPPKNSQLSKMIQQSFGSYEEFVTQFTTAGNTAFGSGWAWLCYSIPQQKLIVTKTIGAGTPLTENSSSKAKVVIPILTMDVWEHAYYLDYQNARPTYTQTFLTKLVNWDFVGRNLKEAIEVGKDEL
mmetsp:Transcript_9140/g.12965  ORF Transcript_9140/g.12965 Transcript_9140/m.12965 type:complete len:247 (+) Transcript_9140:136-876(+)